MKIEAGMYVRTDEGYISKILEFKEHYTKGKRKVDFCIVKEVEENYLSLKGNQCQFIESIDYSIPPCYPSDEEWEKIKSHIIKASYNIIDLIEVGDYVNGCRVHRVGNCLTIILNDEENISWINPNEIKSIVTKEQFEQIEYKVGE